MILGQDRVTRTDGGGAERLPPRIQWSLYVILFLLATIVVLTIRYGGPATTRRVDVGVAAFFLVAITVLTVILLRVSRSVYAIVGYAGLVAVALCGLTAQLIPSTSGHIGFTVARLVLSLIAFVALVLEIRRMKHKS